MVLNQSGLFVTIIKINRRLNQQIQLQVACVWTQLRSTFAASFIKPISHLFKWTAQLHIKFLHKVNLT